MYCRWRNRSLYHELDRCEAQVLDAWRNEHQPGYSVVDALALRASKVSTTLERHPGGNISVTVSIHRKGSRRADSTYFLLQRAGIKSYERVMGGLKVR